MIFGGIDMTMFEVFFLIMAALWVFEGFRNIGKLIGEGVLPVSDDELTKWETLGVVAMAALGGPIFSGWYPAFRDRPRKPAQNGSSLQTSE